MPKFRVEVMRTSYATVRVEVEESDWAAAQKRVMSIAGDFDFSGKEVAADYECTGVSGPLKEEEVPDASDTH